MARGIVYSTERLRTLFEPRSIALVGASEKSTWSLMIHVGLTQGGFAGKVYYINPRNPTVHGQPTVGSPQRDRRAGRSVLYHGGRRRGAAGYPGYD